MQSVSLAAAGMAVPGCSFGKRGSAQPTVAPLAQFDYGAVTLASGPHEEQLKHTRDVLTGLSDDSLLKPLRQMSGQPAPGEDLGGWYHYNPDYVWGRDRDGFAPSCTFGQWVSALARMYAISGDPALRERVLRLNRLYAQTISGDYYEVNRFPTYCYDKIVLGLIDSHKYVGDSDAFSILELTTDTALPHFPKHAVPHDTPWRPNKDKTWTWDESYTISENLFLAYQRGAGDRYRELGRQYFYDEFYDALAEGRNVLAGKHAYSHVNSLSSAMQAYLTLGSQKHLRAAQNAFEMLLQQSYVTGGVPQVAADYRINTYFRDPKGLWVNLYIPSTLRWNHDGADILLTQQTLYPFDDVVQFKVTTSHPSQFALNFRIPTWAKAPSISVNGRSPHQEITPGTFASIQRQWHTGDLVELHLPMITRLEPIDAQHPNIVALAFGPLALLAITDNQPALTRSALLNVTKLDQRTWQVTTPAGPLTLRPFTEITDEQYTTYLAVG